MPESGVMREGTTKPTHWAAVFAVAVGAFALVTTEFLPIGLLPDIARDIGVSEGQTGLMVTLPGLLAAIGAPSVIGFAGGLDRRRVLGGLLILLVASNVVVAAASAFPALLIGRVLLGIGVGGFWAVGGSLGPRLRPGHEGPWATSIIFSGVSVGTVAGLPAGALLGNLLGWRMAFIAAAAVAVLVTAALLIVLPSIPPEEGSGLRGVPSLLKLRVMQVGVVGTVLAFAGHFLGYTYIAPFVDSAAHIRGASLSVVLLAYGVAGFVGNMASGWAAQRSVRGTLALCCALLGLSIAVLVLGGTMPAVAVIAVVIWGFAFGALPIAMRMFMFSAAPDRLESTAAVFVSVAQLSIGGGALIGGLIVDHVGLEATLWAGTVCTLLTAVLVWTVRQGSPKAESVVPA
jgi:predicted MFS family arabinose efflux permease